MLRAVNPAEYDLVAGSGDTVTFVDRDGDRQLSEGDTVLYYTVGGFEMSEQQYHNLSLDDRTFFTDLGHSIDYIFDNPGESIGFILDNLDEIDASLGTLPPATDFKVGDPGAENPPPSGVGGW